MVLDKEGEELLKQLKEYADSKGFKLNPNQKALEGIILGLLRNKKFKGDIYCPCRQVTGDKEKDKEIACPCVFHRGEIELQGKCKCTLFWAK
jgi:ferredoxin-thioredoxin reductase catalytic subunit